MIILHIFDCHHCTWLLETVRRQRKQQVGPESIFFLELFLLRRWHSSTKLFPCKKSFSENGTFLIFEIDFVFFVFKFVWFSFEFDFDFRSFFAALIIWIWIFSSTGDYREIISSRLGRHFFLFVDPFLLLFVVAYSNFACWVVRFPATVSPVSNYPAVVKFVVHPVSCCWNLRFCLVFPFPVRLTFSLDGHSLP